MDYSFFIEYLKQKQLSRFGQPHPKFCESRW